jgi:hypothetical protein
MNAKISLYYTNKQAQFDAQVLLEQLFEAYRNGADTEVCKCIMRKNDKHNEGSNIITPEDLIGLAFKKYQIRKQRKV